MLKRLLPVNLNGSMCSGQYDGFELKYTSLFSAAMFSGYPFGMTFPDPPHHDISVMHRLGCWGAFLLFLYGENADSLHIVASDVSASQFRVWTVVAKLLVVQFADLRPDLRHELH